MTKYLTVKDVMEKLKEFPEDEKVLIQVPSSYGTSYTITSFNRDRYKRWCGEEKLVEHNFIVIKTEAD